MRYLPTTIKILLALIAVVLLIRIIIEICTCEVEERPADLLAPISSTGQPGWNDVIAK